MWRDGECWILAGGPSVPEQFSVPKEIIRKVSSKEMLPSAYSEYLAPIHWKHVIGINNAYQIGPWIDVLFFGDCAWYLAHRLGLLKFPGVKVTCCRRFVKRKREESEGIHYVTRDPDHRTGISVRPSRVGWNQNSGAAAISLAVHFGVKRIILLGFDMRVAGGNSHWHGNHGNKKPPPFKKHMQGFPDIARDAKRRGVEIINASPKSEIKCFPRVSVKELL
jgi:hypothetical protein